MKKKPNILFFLTDDQRFDTIHALGNDEIKTPNLDAFSKECIAFTHAHIMGGTSGAVCMPSRAMMQTGRDVFSLYGEGRSNGAVIPECHTTLPEYLKANGYFTQHIGKWHQDKKSFNRSYSNANSIFNFGKYSIDGRSDWYGTGGHYAPILHDFDPTGEYENEHAFYMKKGLKKGEITPNISDNMHSTDIFCETALDFLDHYDDKEKPFYLYLALVAPHDPRNAPEKYEEMYSPDTVSTPKNFAPMHPFDNGDLFNRDEKLEFFPRREYAVRRHLSDYYSMISHIDARFGDVIQKLKDRGKYDDTIIVFAGDNGLALGQHGLLGKQSVYEHSVRVPLMVKPAGKFTPKYTDAYTYLLDIFPTLCDMIDLPKPESVNGVSFNDVLTGKKEETREDLFLIYRNWQRGYKNKKYKIIEYFAEENNKHTQLFDLENDPCEMNNLAQNPKYADILNDMQQKLYENRVKYHDPLIELSKEELDKITW